MSRANKIKVVVADGRIVYVDGRARLAGEELELHPAEAKALIDQGDVERK